ncbi:hypothetical protein EDB82DRAFT_472427 [Fusarium venenatum]|uniref:uncharacterized protein n=1 Tax=Fusarium venenatum TaxID=56646 RepID=UPI001D27012E|nr:hypothetical protein EDB82DRAFT_472427 [Fusarium venenatum]
MAALTTKPPKHVNHGRGPGNIIDFSGFEGTLAQHSDDISQGSETPKNSPSTNEFRVVEEARVGSFRRHSEENVDAQGPAVRRRTDHLVGIAARLSDTVADWLGHPSLHQGESLYEHLDLAHNRSIDVESQYRQLQMDHQTLQKKFQEAATKLAETVRERNELQKLVDIANCTGAVKTSDDTIRSKWKQLDYNICAMVRALAKYPTRCPTDPVTKERLEAIVSSWRKLLEEDDYKEFLITAYLWAIVNEEIFQSGSRFWGGGFLRGLKNMRRRLAEIAPETDRPSRSEPTMKHVAKWSAQGTVLLGHFYGRDKKAPKRRAAYELDKLEQFCNIAAEKTDTDFLREMKSIVETALDLDEMLMSSMAILSIQWPETGQSKSLPYDADGMDAVVLWHTLGNRLPRLPLPS